MRNRPEGYVDLLYSTVGNTVQNDSSGKGFVCSNPLSDWRLHWRDTNCTQNESGCNYSPIMAQMHPFQSKAAVSYWVSLIKPELRAFVNLHLRVLCICDSTCKSYDLINLYSTSASCFDLGYPLSKHLQTLFTTCHIWKGQRPKRWKRMSFTVKSVSNRSQITSVKTLFCTTTKKVIVPVLKLSAVTRTLQW